MSVALPNFKFKASTNGYKAIALHGEDDWRDLCYISGSRGKWVIELPKETMGPYQTRWKAASAFAERFMTAPWREANIEIIRWWNRQPFAKDDINEEIANEIYDILVAECGASARPDERDSFVYHHTKAQHISGEYRFCGKIGFGGKFRNYSGWWVDCYREEENYNSVGCILHANEKLRALWLKNYGVEGGDPNGDYH